MTFFRKPGADDPAARTREKIGRMVAGDNDLSIIGTGMHIAGDIVTDGVVRVEGRVEGTIRAGRSVVLGKGGEVIGDILTQDAVIGGRVVGTLRAAARLELQSTAEIEGEIHARAQHLQLDEGARFNGQIRMLDEDQPMRALPAESSATQSGNGAFSTAGSESA